MVLNRLKLILSCFLFLSAISFAQPKQNIDWSSFQFLMGKWVGEGNGQPGQGEGSFSLVYDLEKNILVRKNHNEFPATKDKPATIHDDLMIIYPGAKDSFRAIYFDNENHVINYSISFDKDKIIFLSDKIESSPRFRLTYLKSADEKIDIIFEIAMPNNSDAFMKYLEGAAIKVK